MKFFTKTALLTFVMVFLNSMSLHAYSGGSSGVTTGKTSTTSSGCSGCHASSSSSNTTVTRSSGSTTVNAGSTTTFTIQVAHSSRTSTGINIAVKTDQNGNTNAGTLAEDETGLQIMDNEISHSSPKSFSGGTASFTFTWTAPNQAGTYYLRAIANAVNGNGSADGNDQWNWMTPVAITVNAQPALAITAPSSATAWCAGSTQSITWTSSSVNTIKIEISPDGTNYSTIAASVNASAGTYSYQIPSNITPGNQYRIKITDNSNQSLSSTSAPFTIGGGPQINTQPTASQNVCPGQNASLSVTASGAGNTYQWYKDGQIISGATSSTLNISNITSANAGRYYVIVSNSCGNPVTSSDAIVNVGNATMITNTPPSKQNVCLGQSVSLNVTATGENLSYQWRKDGTPIPGATNPTYIVNVVGTQNEGAYAVTVTGTCGTQNSSPTLIEIIKNPTFSQMPVPQIVLLGGTASFSVVAENADTYQWRRNGLDIAGATTATLTIQNVKQSDTGSYDVRIVNTCAASVSTPVRLSISQPGVGAVIAVSTESIDFGTTVTGINTDRTLSITNTGDSLLRVTAITLSGNETKFSIVSLQAPFEILPGNSATMTLRFNSAEAGTFTAQLNFSSNAKSNPNIALSGIAKAPDAPVLTIQNVQFDSTNIFSTSTKTVVVENIGNVSSLISAASFTGQNSTDFTLKNDFTPRTLLAGEKMELEINFTPTVAGSKSAELRLVAEGGDLTAQLTGYARASTSVFLENSFIASAMAVPNPAVESVNIQLQLIKPAIITMYVVNTRGDIVRKLAETTLFNSSEINFLWDGTNDNAQFSGSGHYRIVIISGSDISSIPVTIVR